MSFLTKSKEFIKEEYLLSQGDNILIALSGGPDSVALLRLLLKLKKNYNLSLSAVYVNHNLRPKALKKEIKFCRELCEKYKIEFYLKETDIPKLAKSEKKSVEEIARSERYRFFKELVNAHNFSKIALGHHKDDQVETILFKISRGTGLSGLVGFKAKRDNIIRPLFWATKDQILSFLKSLKQDFCIDRSNKTLDYKRNYIRNKLLPELRKNLNPSIDKSLLNLIANIEDEEKYLAQTTAKKQKTLCQKNRTGKYIINLPKLLKCERWLRRRILRNLLTELNQNGLTPDRETILRLEKLIESVKPSLSLPNRIKAVISEDFLILCRPKKLNFNIELNTGKYTQIEPLGLKIKCSLLKADKIKLIKTKQSKSVFLDFNKLNPPLFVRNIKAGDRFSPLGLKGSKKISEFLTDKKVKSWQKAEIPLICDQTGIIWLAGYEIAERVKIDPNSKEVIKIEIL